MSWDVELLRSDSFLQLGIFGMLQRRVLFRGYKLLLLQVSDAKANVEPNETTDVESNVEPNESDVESNVEPNESYASADGGSDACADEALSGANHSTNHSADGRADDAARAEPLVLRRA